MWDERYNTDDFAYGIEANDFLKSEYHRIPKNGRVLCLAEGEGRNAVFLAQQGYHVTAVDQSSVGLEKAKRLALESDVEISTIAADLADFELEDQAWDGIISISAHVPSALRKKLHAKVFNSLKHNGVFILEAYTEHHITMTGIGGPPPAKKDMFMSLEALKHELKGLDFVVAAEIERHMSEGKFHQGDSAVVQLTAIKST